MVQFNTNETIIANLDGTASKASTLATSRTINGTSFNGSVDITTAKWGAARTITIQDNDATNSQSTSNVNGGADIILKLPATIKATITGNADTATLATKATSDESGNNIKTNYASSISINDHTITLKNKNGDSLGSIIVPDNNTNTTYTFSGTTNGFKVTPSGGTTQTVTVTPSITNNITGTGTSEYLAAFSGTNTITNGPALSSFINKGNLNNYYLTYSFKSSSSSAPLLNSSPLYYANDEESLVLGGPSNIFTSGTLGINHCFIIGSGNAITAVGDGLVCSAILGSSNTIQRSKNFIVGNSNTVSATNGTVFGDKNKIQSGHANACLIGANLISGKAFQLVIGTCNEENSTAAFVIGNGNVDSNNNITQSNALAFYDSGVIQYTEKKGAGGIRARTLRKVDGGDGWNYCPISFTDDLDNAFAQIGCYGVGPDLKYMHLGTETDVDNYLDSKLRIFPNGSLGLSSQAYEGGVNVEGTTTPSSGGTAQPGALFFCKESSFGAGSRVKIGEEWYRWMPYIPYILVPQ